MKDKIVKFLKQPIFIIFLCLALLLGGGIGGVFALYRPDSVQSNAPVYTAPFAFTSDYLTESGNAEPYKVYSDSVTFFLANSDGLTTTKAELIYTLSVTDGGTLSQTQGSLLGETRRTVNITLTGRDTVTVTAHCRSPFSKTLKATFHFVERRSSYEIVDKGTTSELHLYTGVDLPQGGFTFFYCNNLTRASDNLPNGSASWGATSATLTGLQKNTHYVISFTETEQADYSRTERVLSDGAISFFKDNFGVWDWGELETEYTVTFNVDGANEEIAPVTVAKGAYLTKPTDPVKGSKTVDYEFLGWFVDTNNDGVGDREWNFETDTVTSDITLIAKYDDSKQSTKLYT